MKEHILRAAVFEPRRLDLFYEPLRGREVLNGVG